MLLRSGVKTTNSTTRKLETQEGIPKLEWNVRPHAFSDFQHFGALKRRHPWERFRERGQGLEEVKKWLAVQNSDWLLKFMEVI
jgi:hypothetical protein